MRPADGDVVRKWLGDLGVLVAGAMGVDEARAKLAAYANLIADDFPRAAFTRRTLATAGRRFKFFPSFSELSEFLDETHGDLRTKVDRLQALAKPGRQPRTQVEEEPVSIQERQRMGELFGMLAKAMASGDFSDVNAESDRITRRGGGQDAEG